MDTEEGREFFNGLNVSNRFHVRRRTYRYKVPRSGAKWSSV